MSIKIILGNDEAEIPLRPSHIDGFESGVDGCVDRKRKDEKGAFIPEADGTEAGNAASINAIRAFLIDRQYVESEPPH
jgi:hypothetical protein